MKLFIFLLIIPLYSASRLLLPDAFGMIQRNVGRGRVVEASEGEAIEMATIAEEGTAAAESATTIAEVAVVLAPFAPEIILFGGVLALGGLLYEELSHSLNHAKSKSKSTTEPERPLKCRINIQTKMSGGYDQWPLVLEANQLVFKEVYGNGDIDFENREQVRLSCPGQNNIVNILGVSDPLVTCFGGAIFEYNSRHYSFYEFACTRMPESKEFDTGFDVRGYKTFYIGFQTNSLGYLPLIDVFYHNNVVKYTHHHINREVGIDQTKPPQITSGQDFRQGMHPVSGLSPMYNRMNTYNRVERELGTAAAEAWFGVSQSQLDKGHLTPKSDFAYASQQAATFFYLNACPQFHGFNAGNWLKLEKSVRMLAALGGRVDIYTGAKGVLNLHDNNKRMDVYLDDNKNVPIPAYFWKVVKLNLNNMKFAFIGINNPIKDYFYNTEDYYENTFCLQKCWDGEFWWLQDDLNDPNQVNGRTGARSPMQGVILCCIYDDDFKRKTGILVPGL